MDWGCGRARFDVAGLEGLPCVSHSDTDLPRYLPLLRHRRSAGPQAQTTCSPDSACRWHSHCDRLRGRTLSVLERISFTDRLPALGVEDASGRGTDLRDWPYGRLD